MYQVNVEGTKTVLWAAYKAEPEEGGLHQLDRRGRPPRGRAARRRDRPVLVAATGTRATPTSARSGCRELDALRFAREGLPLVVVNPAFPSASATSRRRRRAASSSSALKKQVPGYVDAGFCADRRRRRRRGPRARRREGPGRRALHPRQPQRHAPRLLRDWSARVGGVPDARPAHPGRGGERHRAGRWRRRPTARKHSGRWPPTRRRKYAAHTHFFDNCKARRELGLPSTPLEHHDREVGPLVSDARVRMTRSSRLVAIVDAAVGARALAAGGDAWIGLTLGRRHARRRARSSRCCRDRRASAPGIAGGRRGADHRRRDDGDAAGADRRGAAARAWATRRKLRARRRQGAHAHGRA